METYSRGQSFFEVVVAVALISIVMISLVSLASLSIRASVFSRNQTEASSFTEQASEWLKSEKDANWAAFDTHAATADWCLDNLSWAGTDHVCLSSPPEVIPGTVLVRSLKFTRNPDGSISADISTGWQDSQGDHSVITSEIYANWQ